MYKQFHHFAEAQGAEHPGQPVHSDLHFDVWVSLSPERPPLYYLIDEDGQRIEFETPEKAIEHGRSGAISTPAPAADQPGDLAEKMDTEFRADDQTNMQK